MKYDSDEFAEMCNHVDEYFGGKIVQELRALGWENVIENMERVNSNSNGA